MTPSASDVGTTFQLGPFVVRISLRHDNPAFPRYLIFRGDRLVGKQFSRPNLGDCERLERREGVYSLTTRNLTKRLMEGHAPMNERQSRGGRNAKTTRQAGG